MPSVPGEKHYILYARQNLKDTRLLLAGLFVAYLGLGIYNTVSHGYDWSQLGQWALYSTFPLIVFVALWVYSRATYSQVQDDGVHVRFPIRKATIPYADIEKVRIDTVDRIFDRPDRTRMRTRAVKNLGDARAVCIRLRGDDLQDELRHRLGPRMVLDRELVLPVSNADGVFLAVRSRLGSRRSAVSTDDSEGGGRRRKRKKGRR